MKILITRPEPDASILAKNLIEAGHEVVNLPLLQITLQAQEIVNQGQQFIFVSKNAVRGMRNLAELKDRPVFAMGPGTAELLESAGLEAIYPHTLEGSQAFLQLPALQQIEGQRFTIICGSAARPELSAGLIARGALVDSVSVYVSQRQILSPAQQQLVQAEYDLVIVTSLEALRYACELGIRRDASISVLSENMLKCAQDYGFSRILKNGSV